MNQGKCAGTGDGQALESPARLLAWFSWDVEMDEGRAQCCCAEPPEGAGLDPKVPEPGACSVPTLPGLSPGLGPQRSSGIHLQPAPSMAPALCHHSTLAVTLVSVEPEVATVYPLLASGSSLATEDALLLVLFLCPTRRKPWDHANHTLLRGQITLCLSLTPGGG